jgi:hypothetical protein
LADGFRDRFSAQRSEVLSAQAMLLRIDCVMFRVKEIDPAVAFWSRGREREASDERSD